MLDSAPPWGAERRQLSDAVGKPNTSFRRSPGRRQERCRYVERKLTPVQIADAGGRGGCGTRHTLGPGRNRGNDAVGLCSFLVNGRKRIGPSHHGVRIMRQRCRILIHGIYMRLMRSPDTPTAPTGPPPPPAGPSPADRAARRAVTVFPVLVIAAGAAGLAFPGTFAGYGTDVPYLLGVIMFCMGLTMSLEDFKGVARRPWVVLLGLAAHYVIMPGLGWLIAHLLHLSPALAAGVILVGCAPSGTASNVVTYLARGDVALSVSVATVSTVLAPLLTPPLT